MEIFKETAKYDSLTEEKSRYTMFFYSVLISDLIKKKKPAKLSIQYSHRTKGSMMIKVKESVVGILYLIRYTWDRNFKLKKKNGEIDQ